jgi:hypothetical protein
MRLSIFEKRHSVNRRRSDVNLIILSLRGSPPFDEKIAICRFTSRFCSCGEIVVAFALPRIFIRIIACERSIKRTAELN